MNHPSPLAAPPPPPPSAVHSTSAAADANLLPGQLVANKWRLIQRIGRGAFGDIFIGTSDELQYAGQRFAIKLEKLPPPPPPPTATTNEPQESGGDGKPILVAAAAANQARAVLKLEAVILSKMQRYSYVGRFIEYGRDLNHNVAYLLMSLLGENLLRLRRRREAGRFSLPTILRFGIQALRSIQGIHEVGFIHRDIKPSNFVIGSNRGTMHGTAHDTNEECDTNGASPSTHTASRIFLIDFGLARCYRDRTTGKVLASRGHIAGFRGTPRYASIHVHREEDLGRRDDLWSLFYILLEFLAGDLPWGSKREKDEIGRVKEEYHATPSKLLRYAAQAISGTSTNGTATTSAREFPSCFHYFLKHLLSLQFESKPNYAYLIELLQQKLKKLGYGYCEGDGSSDAIGGMDAPMDWEDTSTRSTLDVSVNSNTGTGMAQAHQQSNLLQTPLSIDTSAPPPPPLPPPMPVVVTLLKPDLDQDQNALAPPSEQHPRPDQVNIAGITASPSSLPLSQPLPLPDTIAHSPRKRSTSKSAEMTPCEVDRANIPILVLTSSPVAAVAAPSSLSPSSSNPSPSLASTPRKLTTLARVLPFSSAAIGSAIPSPTPSTGAMAAASASSSPASAPKPSISVTAGTLLKPPRHTSSILKITLDHVGSGGQPVSGRLLTRSPNLSPMAPALHDAAESSIHSVDETVEDQKADFMKQRSIAPSHQATLGVMTLRQSIDDASALLQSPHQGGSDSVAASPKWDATMETPKSSGGLALPPFARTKSLPTYLHIPPLHESPVEGEDAADGDGEGMPGDGGTMMMMRNDSNGGTTEAFSHSSHAPFDASLFAAGGEMPPDHLSLHSFLRPSRANSISISTTFAASPRLTCIAPSPHRWTPGESPMHTPQRSSGKLIGTAIINTEEESSEDERDLKLTEEEKKRVKQGRSASIPSTQRFSLTTALSEMTKAATAVAAPALSETSIQSKAIAEVDDKEEAEPVVNSDAAVDVLPTSNALEMLEHPQSSTSRTDTVDTGVDAEVNDSVAPGTQSFSQAHTGAQVISTPSLSHLLTSSSPPPFLHSSTASTSSTPHSPRFRPSPPVSLAPSYVRPVRMFASRAPSKPLTSQQIAELEISSNHVAHENKPQTDEEKENA